MTRRSGGESRDRSLTLLLRGWGDRCGLVRENGGSGDGFQAETVCLAVLRAPAFAVAAFLRPSTVCAPNFLVKRSTRPSVSISFCRPVKNGCQFALISWRRSGLADWVYL